MIEKEVKAMSDENKSEPIILKDMKDVLFGISLSGIMLMLSGEENTIETQTKAVEYFRDNESKSSLVRDWCDYQLTLLNTGEYMIPIPDNKSFTQFIVNLIQEGKEVDKIRLCLLAASQHEAGSIMSSKSPLYKSFIEDYCDNILFTKIEDYSKLNRWDKFSLVTGSVMYYSLSEINISNQFDNYIDEVLEADKKIVEKVSV